MSPISSAYSRRRFVGMAAAVGAIPLAAGAVRSVAAAPLLQDANATPAAGAASFANGINASSYVGGDGSYAKYKSDGLRLGLIESYPVNFTDPNTKQRTGWNTDLVLAALAHIGISKIEYVEGPWETMVPGLQSSHFDLLASDVHVTPDRIKVIDFSAPVFWYGDALFVPKGNPGNLHHWEDLAGKTVGVGLGTNYAEWLQKRTDLKELKTYQDSTLMATDMMAGRLDAIIAEDSNFTALLLKNTNIAIEAVPDYVPQSDLSDWTRFGIRQSDRDLNDVFSRAIIEMLISGETLAILKKYGLGVRNLTVFPGVKG